MTTDPDAPTSHPAPDAATPLVALQYASPAEPAGKLDPSQLNDAFAQGLWLSYVAIASLVLIFTRESFLLVIVFTFIPMLAIGFCQMIIFALTTHIRVKRRKISISEHGVRHSFVGGIITNAVGWPACLTFARFFLGSHAPSMPVQLIVLMLIGCAFLCAMIVSLVLTSGLNSPKS